MPLYYQHTVNETTKLGVWHIQEAENFFLQKVPLQQRITHPHKRLQHLAGRYLLQYLFPDFPYAEILIADTKKPFLIQEQYHFSISHGGDFAAAIVSSTNRVGIDIEMPSEKVARIAHKFVHEKEKRFLVNCEQLAVSGKMLTVLWSAKEAVFKWHSLGGIDFKEHMQLVSSIQKQNGSLLLPFVFKKENEIYLYVHSKIFETEKSETSCIELRSLETAQSLDIKAFDELVLSWVL